MSEVTYKDIKFGKEAKLAIKKGIDITANAVKVTMGVTGKSVIIENPFGAPYVADDGVTVAKSIVLKDKYENMGAQFIQEIAKKTDETAGDGTTTATVIAQKMLEGAFGEDNVVSDTNETELKQQMEQALGRVVTELQNMKRDCTAEDIEKVATVSSLDPQVGKLIAEILQEVGKDGIVTVEETQKLGINKEVVKGLRFDRGFVSAYMITDPSKQEAVLGSDMGQARVFVTDKKIVNNEDIVPILEACARATIRDILIVAEEIEGEALATCVVNRMKNGWNIVAAKAPGFLHDKTEQLKNIATLTGATFYSEELKQTLKSVTANDFGRARKIVVTKDHTTIIDGQGEQAKIDELIKGLRVKLMNPDLDEMEKARAQRNLANLSGGIGVIKVGGYTETETKAKRYKIEDALNASKAAIAEGIVIGGGSALCKVAEKLIVAEDNPMNKGSQIVYDSLFAPISQMAQNRGLGDVAIISEVQMADKDFGYNFKTGQLEDLFESGIVDPYKVIRLALENAFSIVSTVITLEAAITEVKEHTEGGDKK